MDDGRRDLFNGHGRDIDVGNIFGDKKRFRHSDLLLALKQGGIA
jgi:hypothetical protein